ncbi:MAG: tetratricopeptide repeat protein, partial [Planctomycetota bacterium]
GDAMTTASDVYSLGVLLFELLTDDRPHRLDRRTPMSFARSVHDVPASRPSTVLAQLPANDLARVASRRGTTPERLVREVRGDLDTIVLMALRKDADRRYASAEALARDVERTLMGLPVTARPDTALYRGLKFVRRNRALVAAGCLAFLAMVGAIVGTSMAARAAGLERDGARRAQQHAALEARHARIEADSAHEIAGFLGDTLLSIHGQPDLRALAGTVSRRAHRVRREHAAEPHLSANLLDALGRVCVRARLLDLAASLIEEAARLRREHFGPGSLEAALSLDGLGLLHAARGDHEASIRSLSEALRIHRTAEPGVHTDVAHATSRLAHAMVAVGAFEEAELLEREACELHAARAGRVSLPVAASLDRLAAIARSQGRAADAARLSTQAERVRRVVLRPDPPGSTAYDTPGSG